VEDIRAVTAAASGRFFEREPAFLQEPHWPFAWGEAAHNWILRLDTDEFPAADLRQWLQAFRRAAEAPADLAGYSCIWPLWNGRATVTKKWPSGRLFLFHKQRVRFFGMCEQTPVPDSRVEPLPLTLQHQPLRKSYGLTNALMRGQSRRGAQYIAQCLLGKPTDLAGWRWEDPAWPAHWEQIRRRPWWTAGKRLVRGTLATVRDQWRTEGRVFPLAALGGTLHQALVCLEYARLRRRAGTGRNALD